MGMTSLGFILITAVKVGTALGVTYAATYTMEWFHTYKRKSKSSREERHHELDSKLMFEKGE
jgi:ABC-type nickel/cobalt efflux system permease component RcnA